MTETTIEEYVETCNHSPNNSEISNDKKMFVHEYPFLDNFSLIANVDRKTGKQYLVIKHNPSGTSDSLTCIHTALAKISKEEYNMVSDSDDVKKLYAKTSENVYEVNLSSEERFYAFKSWVSGIAEAGMDAFKIQSEIEDMANFSVPITSFLMKFIAQHDMNVFYDFIAKIERDCMFEGSCHESSIIANLLPIINMLDHHLHDENKNKNIIKAIMEINPPEALFLTNEDIFYSYVNMNAVFDEFYKKIKKDPSVITRNIRIILKLITNDSRNDDQRLMLLKAVLETSPEDTLFINDDEIMVSFIHLDYETFHDRFISGGKIRKNIDYILKLASNSNVEKDVRVKLLGIIRENNYLEEIFKYTDIMYLFLETDSDMFFDLLKDFDMSKNIDNLSYVIHKLEERIDDHETSIEYKHRDIESGRIAYEKKDTDDERKKDILQYRAGYEKEIAECIKKIDRCNHSIFNIAKRIDTYADNFALFTSKYAFRYYVKNHSHDIVNQVSVYLDSIAKIDANQKLKEIRNLFCRFAELLDYESEIKIDAETADACIEKIMQTDLPTDYLKGLEDYEVYALFKCNCIASAKYADKMGSSGNLHAYRAIIQRKEFADTRIMKIIIDMAISKNDEFLLLEIARTEHLAHLTSFRKLFGLDNKRVIEELARNQKAKQCTEFKQFFNINTMFKDKVMKIRNRCIRIPKFSDAMEIVAKDPQNPLLFDEYRNLFYSESDFVMDFVMQNPNAVRFELEYRRNMFNYRQSAAENPNASKFPEYSEFYSMDAERYADLILKKVKGKPTEDELDLYKTVREGDSKRETEFFAFISLNPRGSDDPKYRKLFYRNHGNFPDIFNINAVGYKEFNDSIMKIYEDRHIYDFPYLLYFPAYKKHLEDVLECVNEGCMSRWRIGMYDAVQSPVIAREFPSIFKQYFKNVEDFCGLFGNPYIYLYPNHVMRAMRDNRLRIYDLRRFASNKYACFVEEAYRPLFKNNELIEYIAENPNAVQFGEFINVFRHKEEDVWENLAENRNAPFLFRDQFRKIFKREDLKAQIEEMGRESYYHNDRILGHLAENPNAVQFKEFKMIISDKNNYKLVDNLLKNTAIPLYYPLEYKSLIYHVFDECDDDAMGLIAGNPNAALMFGKEIDLLMQERLKNIPSEHVVKFISKFASGSYFAHMKSFRQLFKEKIVDVDIRLAYNDGATTLPEFIPFMNDIIDQVNRGLTRCSYSWHSDSNPSVLAAFSENLTLPLVYPQKFKELLYMDQYHVRSYAFNNPSAFDIIYPEILKHNKKIMINKKSRPIFVENSWRMRDQNYSRE